MNSNDLINAGFHIFPMRPNVKAGYYKGVSWIRTTTNDPVKAKGWHAGIIMGEDDDGNPVSFEGCNWGIACGPSDICVVDFDVKDGAKGALTKKRMEEEHGKFDPAFITQTKSGGAHFYFKGKCASQNNFMGTKDDKSGVDIKSDGGMVMAPGCLIDGSDGYKIVKGTPGNLTPTPQWIIETLGQRNDRKATLAVSGEEMTEARRAELMDALDSLDPSMPHDEWVKIGQGIHHSYPGPDGLEAWKEWSSGCPGKYNGALCDSKWNSFRRSDDPAKDITIASVFHEARNNGWTGASAAAAFSGHAGTQTYAEQLADAATHGNTVAISMEASIDPDAFIEMMPMNQAIKEGHAMPPAKRLFDDLMFEGETTILFSRSNVGKTALGTQIANSIAGGDPINGFVLETTGGEKVLYWDFELSKKQVSMRYDNPAFSDNLIRCAINPNAPVPVNSNHSAIMYAGVERSVVKTGIKKLIIDNLTYMGEDLAEGAEALLLMKRLKDLKERHGLTMLIDAHTPKIEPFKPIHLNHLAGSANLGNFIDACFALGEVKGLDNMRYIKQLKVRSTALKYGAGNVILCELKKENGMLQFIHRGTRPEDDLIKGRLAPDGETSVPNQRRDFIKIVMGQMLVVDEVVTMRSLAQSIADESLKNITTRGLFNDGAYQRVYATMIEMLCGENTVWFDLGGGRNVEFFKSRDRMSSHVKGCRSEYGVRMVLSGEVSR